MKFMISFTDFRTFVAISSKTIKNMYLRLQDFFSRCNPNFQNSHKKILKIKKISYESNIFLNKQKQSKKLTLYSGIKILQGQYQ